MADPVLGSGEHGPPLPCLSLSGRQVPWALALWPYQTETKGLLSSDVSSALSPQVVRESQSVPGEPMGAAWGRWGQCGGGDTGLEGEGFGGWLQL